MQQRSHSLKRTSDLLGEQWYRMLQLLSEKVHSMLGRLLWAGAEAGTEASAPMPV